MTEITVRLDRPEELFAAPDPDPLAGRFETRSGMDRLVEALGTAATRDTLTVAVEVPDAAPDLETRLGAAVTGYVEHRVAQLRAAKRRIERRGLTELAVGLVFLATCIVLSSAGAALPAGPEWLRLVLAEGLVIVGWIALWHPVDMLLFDRCPLHHEIVLLRAIARAPLSVRPADAVRDASARP